MASVALNPSAPVKQASSMFSSIISFLQTYWIAILLFIFLAIFVALFFVLRKQQELERKERDSEAYANFNSTIADCKLNANKKWMKKNYSLVNLFWLGIPFKWSEHSAKLRDMDGQLIGYYRGHYSAQDGSMNYLVYKSKMFGIVENLFLLKYLKKINIPIPKEDPSDKKEKQEYKTLVLSNLVTKDRINDDIHFQAVGVQKISQYYRSPNFVYNETRDVIDLRKYMVNTIMEETWKLGFERLVGTSAKTVRKAIDGNPFVQTKKQTGEIEQENREIEEEEGYAK